MLRLIAEGNANKEITEQLSVSEDTAKGQVRNIPSKLGAKAHTQVAMIGVKRGIIELNAKTGYHSEVLVTANADTPTGRLRGCGHRRRGS